MSPWSPYMPYVVLLGYDESARPLFVQTTWGSRYQHMRPTRRNPRIWWRAAYARAAAECARKAGFQSAEVVQSHLFAMLPESAPVKPAHPTLFDDLDGESHA